MTAPHLLVHDRRDNVGVVGWSRIWSPAPICWRWWTEDNSDFRIAAKQATPIGHKIAPQ